MGGRGASLERARVAERFSGPGAQRGFPSAELLPAVAVVLAGRDQGGVPRAREHRRQLRPRGAQPELRDEAAERGLAQDLREAVDATRPSPGSTCSCATASPASIAATRDDLTFDHLLPRSRGGHTTWDNVVAACSPCNLRKGSLTPAEAGDVAVADAVPADGASPAPQRPAVPAELSARELARLSLLGYRTRAVTRAAFSRASEPAMTSTRPSRRGGATVLFALCALMSLCTGRRTDSSNSLEFARF